MNKDDFYNGCVMPLVIDLIKQLITCDPKKMVYLYGDKIESIVEVDDGKVLAKSLEKNVLLILEDWKIIREVEVKA